jgi:phage N-6-adenine-methyltransferase
MDVHFSSNSNEWQTPRWLFDRLNTEFGFDLDCAATAENALCPRFYTAEQDALKQDWGKDGTTGFLNPPYGKLIGRFVPYAFSQTERAAHLTVVMLIPARVDTKWWHAACPFGEVRFLKGRIGFVNPTLPSYRADGVFKVSPAPFPSAIVILGAKARRGHTEYVSYKPSQS